MELGTLIAGIFLVFSGMLIGYFLFYRDRSGLENERMALGNENEDLRTSLKLAHNSHAQLDERFTRQKGQLNVLQQLCDDWSSSREQVERERAQLEMEAQDKMARYKEAMETLQAEKNLRIELEDQNHKLKQEQLVAVSQLEDSWRQRHAKVESSLFQRQADLKSTTSEKERLTQQLHSAEARIAELMADLAGQNSLLETATANASGLKQEYVSVESALKENSAMLKKANADCAAALSAQRVAEESLVGLQKDYESLQTRAEELRSKLAAMESLEAQVLSLQESLQNSTTQVEKVAQQRDTALEAEKAALNRASGMQQRIANQETTIHTLRAKRETVMQNLQAEVNKRAELEIGFEKRASELTTELHQQTTRLRDQTSMLEQRAGEMTSRFEQERVDLRSQISTQSKSMEELTAKRDQLKSELEETQLQLEIAKEELAEATTLTGELTEQVGQLKETCQRIKELEHLVQNRDSEEALINKELKTLRAQYADAYEKQKRMATELEMAREAQNQQTQVVAELEALRAQYEASQEKQALLEAELVRVANERQQLKADYGQYDGRIAMLQSKLKASEETIRNLRRERAGVLARLANYRTIAEPDATVISFTEAMAQRKQESKVYDQEYGGHTSVHETRGTIYTEAPETRDDLKRISGIAEVLEARLNDYGIYTFKQIMEWSPNAIEEFSRLLTFKDRIERDDWLGQARFFYEEKQTAKRDSVAA